MLKQSFDLGRSSDHLSRDALSTRVKRDRRGDFRLEKIGVLSRGGGVETLEVAPGRPRSVLALISEGAGYE
jgi:hypothetical protein